MDFFLNVLKTLTFFLDKAIFGLAKAAYSVFFSLSNATLVNSDVARNFTYRMYALIGIIMVFVLAYNLLNYIVDPDKVNDKKVGATTFVKDVVIALAVISLTPMLFTKLYSLQNAILSSNVIANLVLGGNSAANTQYDPSKYSSLTDYYIHNGANNMIASIYVAFLYPNDGFTALDCEQSATNGSNPLGTNITNTQVIDYAPYCQAYSNVKENGDLNEFEIFYKNSSYNFTPFISTVAGVVLLFFMLSFCLNLAKRVAKLAIVQLIAPVPVALELLPNKKGVRKNWIETLIKVYLEVFMYLLIMYIIILLISFIPGTISTIIDNAFGDGFNLARLIATVLLIFGLLMFGKEAPKMLFDLLGLKESGVVGEVARRALAMGSVSFGLAGSTFGRFARNFNATDGNAFDKFRSGVGGAASGFARTLWNARNVHNFQDARKLRRNVNERVTTARVNRDAYAHAHGDSLRGVLGGHIRDVGRSANLNIRSTLGAENKYQRTKNTEQVMTEFKKLYNDELASIWKNDAQFSSAAADFNRYTNMISSGAVRDTDRDLRTGKTYGELKAAAKKMRDARQQELLQINRLKFMEAAGKLNNFLDTHQGVEGISKYHINVEDIANLSGWNPAASDTVKTAARAAAKAQLDRLNFLIKDGIEPRTGARIGFDPTLEGIEHDIPYQRERVDEKLQADAREARRKAAQQANQNNNNNNNNNH